MEAVVAQERAALEIYRGVTSLVIAGSQPGDERPLACVRCAPRRHAGSSSSSSGGGVVATGSLSSHVKLWDGESLELLGTLRGGGGGVSERRTRRRRGRWGRKVTRSDARALRGTRKLTEAVDWARETSW